MASGERKKRSFLGSFLKAILVIVIVIVTLIIGGYLILKYAVGIDIIDIKHKLNLLNANVNESEIISNPYSNADAFDAFNVMFGENNNVYVQDGETFTFNAEELTNASLISDEMQLTSNQLAGCTNVFISNSMSSDVDVSGFTLEAELKQLMFSNLRNEEDVIKVDVNSVVKFDFAILKNEIKKANNFFGNFILRYIPNNIYLTLNTELTIDAATNNGYTVTSKGVKINNLSEKQSNEVLDIFSKLYTDRETTLETEITTQFTDLIFSCNGNSLLSSLNVESFTFKVENDQIFVVLFKGENI